MGAIGLPGLGGNGPRRPFRWGQPCDRGARSVPGGAGGGSCGSSPVGGAKPAGRFPTRLPPRVQSGLYGFAAGTVAASAATMPLPLPMGVQRRRRSEDRTEFMHDERRSCTNALLLVNIACFLGQVVTRGGLTSWGAKVNLMIDKGQYWRLATASVLHVNLMHLLVNSYSLHSIGPHLEAIVGKPRFLATYVAGALLGNGMSYRMCPNPAVGASGAILGVAGGLTVYYWRHRHQMGRHGLRMLQRFQKVLVLNLLMGLVLSKNIDNWGHVGGLLGGAATGWALGPDLKMVPSRDSIFRRVAGERVTFVDDPPWKRLLPGGSISYKER